jgi:hypothetical protein
MANGCRLEGLGIASLLLYLAHALVSSYAYSPACKDTRTKNALRGANMMARREWPQTHRPSLLESIRYPVGLPVSFGRWTRLIRAMPRVRPNVRLALGSLLELSRRNPCRIPFGAAHAGIAGCYLAHKRPR